MTLQDWLKARETELEGQYQDKADGKEILTHCPTGLKRMDQAGLVELGICTVVLGHEGDGKSALGLQMVEGAARAGYDVQGYWPEDPRRFVADRIFAKAMGESAASLRRLKVSDAPERLRAALASASWTGRVHVDDSKLTSTELVSNIKARLTPATRMVLVDYAQVLSAETDEKSVERVITRTVWNLNEVAKDHNLAVVLLSQVRSEVKERGRRLFDSWRYRNPDKKPTEEAIEGYRPMAGDGQWAPSALGQKARAVIGWFRPKLWLRQHGVEAEDNVAEATIIKSNYGPGAEVIRLGWDGPTTSIYDPRDPSPR